ncbi:MAG: ATP-dependent DNA helicase RecG [Campylobacterota bacterium]
MQGFHEEVVVQKLQLKTLLDLALTVPRSYEDRRLATAFESDTIQTFAVKVLGIQNQNQTLKISFYLKDFDQNINATLFHPKPFHYKAFASGSELFVMAKTGLFNGFFQLTQPKIVTKVGGIEPIYKEPKIKQVSLKAVIKKYLTQQNLAACRLNKEEIAQLLAIHFPKKSIDFEDSSVLRVLKSVEALNHMQKLRGKKREYAAIRRLNGELSAFLQKLPFTLTQQQQTAIEDIKKDLNANIAAKRMIVGDVGSGKTMTILAAAQLAYPHKTILMAPTSILAKQLFEEASKYLDFDIALVSASKNIGDYKTASFVIGTHALLYKDDLPAPSLVMVDEQHRFGVKQRHKLNTLMQNSTQRPHFLQFSATPIPRTQAMIDSNMIDISLITTTPFKKDITTSVIGISGFKTLLEHIKSEIAKTHQVLIIYPLVNESENFNYQSLEEGKDFWLQRFQNVFVTHGKDKEKDSVLQEFAQSGDILLATTVVEVGISLPRLTTIVIVGAENMGLATLHQLRGRVSRNGLKGYCYLFTKSKKSERLERFCQTDNGFDIAKLDLAFRKGGDLIEGKAQSGAQFRWLDMAEDEDIIKAVQARIV